MTGRLTIDDRVLVRMPNWLGDFVMAEPLVRALYERLERAGRGERITLAAPGRLLELFDGRFALARRLAVPAHAPIDARTWRGHDAAVLLDGSTRSAWAAFVARIPLRAGFAGGARAALLTDAFTPARERGRTPLGLGIRGQLPRRLPRPFGSSCIELGGWLGIAVSETTPRLAVHAGALARIRARLAQARVGTAASESPSTGSGGSSAAGFVLANAGARPASSKAFPAASFAAALDELARESELPIVIACGPGEETNARETARACARARVVLFDDPPVELAELVALTSLAELVVGPDSGPRHLAVALGVPVVAVCGPTDPRHTADHLARTRIVRVEVPCGPCHRERCPLAGDAHELCMHAIDPRAVATAAGELLAGEAPLAPLKAT
jgi:heptosyltransferase-2